MLSILILAAGQSRRMRGRDKHLELVDNIPCTELIARQAIATGLDVRIVVPDLIGERARALSGYHLVPSPNTQNGMACSLKSGLESLPNNVSAVIILLGDMPEITQSDLQQITETFDQVDKGIIQSTTFSGEPGHPVLICRRYFPELMELTGDQGAKKVIQAHSDDIYYLRLEGNRAHNDLDSPEQWEEWRRCHAMPTL
ncbi:MAG: nucleotidyltransferase family protein [Aestuariivita sp.]|nr:nucleotidyltransferase family protein [Aestuariivita sp.]MCY4345320.1 nucleotidyltransferase family protein [Aestuariivita sp.]